MAMRRFEYIPNMSYAVKLYYTIGAVHKISVYCTYKIIVLGQYTILGKTLARFAYQSLQYWAYGLSLLPLPDPDNADYFSINRMWFCDLVVLYVLIMLEVVLHSRQRISYDLYTVSCLI